MPINKLSIGTRTPKSIYIRDQEAKLIYLNTDLIYAQTLTVTLTLENVASVLCEITELDGSTNTREIYKGFEGIHRSFNVGYGAKVIFKPVAEEGYTLGTYSAEATITCYSPFTFSATRTVYDVIISPNPNITAYAYDVWDANGNKTITNGKTSPVKVEHGGRIRITRATAATGFSAVYSSEDQVITSNSIISIAVKYTEYKVTIRTMYAGNVYTSKVGTVYYKSGYIGGSLTSTHGTTCTTAYGFTIQLRDPTPVLGFKFSKYIIDGVPYTKDYVDYTSPAKDYTIDVVFEAVIVQANILGSGYTNAAEYMNVTKTGLDVTVNCKIEVGQSYPAGATIATIPVGYRPITDISWNVVWRWYRWENSTNTWDINKTGVYATITIKPDGTICSNQDGYNKTIGSGNDRQTTKSYLVSDNFTYIAQ